jgi:CRISPR-associated endonuclease/helicase Cas3
LEPSCGDKAGSERSRENSSTGGSGKSFRCAALAEAIVQEHATGTLSLVVCNTVRLAQLLSEAVARKRADCADAIMLTSRFRPMDRQEMAAKLIEFERARKNCRSHRGLVCISTQVVEAGIDVSARRLWSEIAPWSSVLQRLGRLNRDGRINDEALAFFLEFSVASKSRERAAQAAGPYEPKNVADGKKLVTRLVLVSTENPHASFHKLHSQLAATRISSSCTSILDESQVRRQRKSCLRCPEFPKP